MEQIKPFTYRTITYKKDANLGDNKYDYAANGVLTHALPHIIFRGNSILVAFLQLVDVELITLMKVIQKIQNIKHITSY